MARVVTQRKRPPYLLLIMTFLFMVAAAIAVKERMGHEAAARAAAEARQLHRALVNQEELRTGRVQAMIQRHDSPPEGDLPRTVVGQFSERIGELTAVILTVGASADQAIADAQRVTRSADGTHQRGLVAEVERLKAQLARLVGPKGRQETGVVRELKERILNLYKQLEARDAQLQILDGKLRLQIAALERLLQERDRAIQAEHADHLRLRKEGEDFAARRAAALNAKIDSSQAQVLAKDKTLMLRDAKVLKLERFIAYLEGLVSVLKTDKIRKDALARKIIPDGAVMGDPDRDGYCYIDVGEANGIKHGWVFTVYESAETAGITRRKGALVVTRVLPNISECRLTSDVGGDVYTVTKGDLVSNVAFDRRYPRKFVVAGLFDLHGAGRATQAGTKAVKKMIRSHRATVVETVTVDVDYVVLGAEPPRPPAATADDPPQVRWARREAAKAADHYQAIKKRAIELKIPVMNTGRFVRDMGYVNEKRLVYSD